VNPLHQDVYDFLLDRHCGVENAAPRERILTTFNVFKNRDLNDRVFRKIVSDLVVDHHKAICTSSEIGYYVARTSRELDAAAADLESKGAACFERARQLRACEPKEKQESLF